MDRSCRSSTRLVTLAAASLLLAGCGGAQSTRAAHPAQQRPVAGETRGAPILRDAQVHDVLDRYAAAYSGESVAALRALFTPGFTRTTPGKAAESRDRALATYAGQFRALTNPYYRLSGVSISRGRSLAIATGRYAITSATGTVSGRIAFVLTPRHGGLLINRIVATPARAPAISRADAAAVVESYARAYSSKSVAALAELFAPGFTRKNQGDPSQDRSAALGAYGSQFAQLSNPRYVVSGLSVATRPGGAFVTGRYRIASASGVVTGRVGFDIARIGGRLLITHIGTTPQGAAPRTQPTPPPKHSSGGSSGSSGGTGSSGSGGTTCRLAYCTPYSLPPTYVPDLY
jgi:uncharacterized protein DUF4440